MSPDPISIDGGRVDLSRRVFKSAAVVASPAAADETIVCSVTCGEDVAALEGIALFGFVAFTVGTAGVSVVTRIRRTNVAGTAVVASGATNEGVTAATQLGQRTILGFDTGPTMPGQIYVMTLTFASASAESAVSAAQLVALVV